MPDMPSIIVSYTVEDSEEYESIAERIDSIEREPEKEEFISGQVENIVKSREYITGVVYEVANK